MNTQPHTENTTPTYPGTVPPKNKRRWIAPTAIGAAALLIGVGIGSAGGTEATTTVSQPTPAPTVTVTPEPVTETVTETVETTPEACLTALDLSGDAINISSQVIDAQSEAIMIAAGALDNPFSVSDSDIDRIVELTEQINGHTADIEAMTPEAGAAAAECRGA